MISAAVVQTGGSTGTGAGTTTVSAVSGDPWSAPTSGNILLALSVTDNDGATVSINAISGWTRLLSTSNAQMSYALDAKISDGSEAIIAMTVTGTPADRALAVTEWPSTDLDTAIANWQALADESSIASNVTSQATAALTNASANAAVYYVWGIESGHNWDTTLSYTAGTEQVKQTALGNGFRGGNIVATEVVSASASRSSTVSGALSAGKIVGITLVIPGTAVSVTAADGTVQIGEAGLTHAPVAAGTEVYTATGLTGNIVKAWIL